MANDHKHSDECKCPKWVDVWQQYVQRTGWIPKHEDYKKK